MITQRRIARLPQVVADSIAAGEVIERPASVVKELVENALDARARRVDVDIDGGGLVRIAVVDDGEGIDAEELDIAVARHATSKIAAVDDLTRVDTLGFRGEALASIAAVAELRINTRTHNETAGALLRARGGDIVERRAAASAVGTRVEVLELFATTPARLRFLRSTATEASAAARVLGELALTRPDVAFTCRCDGRVTFRTPAGTLRDALRGVFGARATADLVDIEVEPDAVAVSGAISMPTAHRGNRTGLILVVNGRRVHNRALLFAVEDVYRGLIPSGRHPYGVVSVDIDPAAVDVNVHPAKREVRFHDERAVFVAVQRACWATVRAAPIAPTYMPLGERVLPSQGPLGAGSSEIAGAAAPRDVTRSHVMHLEDGAEPVPARVNELRELRALGQVNSRWMVAEMDGGVVLVDPHAAHEKIVYTRLIEAWNANHDVESQLLLIPAVIECGPLHVQRAEIHAAFIASCGIGVEPFGPDTLRCVAVPAGESPADPQRLVIDLLEALDEDRAVDAGSRHRAAALIACHSAIRFGDRIGIDEQQRLLDELALTPGGTTCPHGRPAIFVLDDAGLRRIFRRPPS